MSSIASSAYRLINNALPAGAVERLRRLVPVAVKQRVATAALRNTSGEVDVADGRKFVMISDPIFFRVAHDGDYEPRLSELLRQIVEPGDTCLDVGANFGWYTTLFGLLVGPEGTVVSFEPGDNVRATLLENVALNDYDDRVVVHPACVGAAAGFVELEQPAVGGHGLSHVRTGSDTGVVTSRNIPVMTIDDVVGGLEKSPAVMKVDVEGFEGDVLEGATELLAGNDAPIVQIEVNAEALERYGRSIDSVIGILEQAGYTMWGVADDGTLRVPDGENDPELIGQPPGHFGGRIDRYRRATRS